MSDVFISATHVSDILVSDILVSGISSHVFSDTFVDDLSLDSFLWYLIPRYYDVTKGSVKVDGVDVRDMTQKELRDKLDMCRRRVYFLRYH